MFLDSPAPGPCARWQERRSSARHSFLFLPFSEAEADIAWLPGWQEGEFDTILFALEVAPLDSSILTYFYPDSMTKEAVTGNAGNGHANTLNYEVHAIYGGGIFAVGAHEDTHVVAWHRIGNTDYALMGEGLAVMVDGLWWGETLDYWASMFLAAGSIPSLPELIDNFWSYDDTMTYPLAGHFAEFLRSTVGIDALKRLYVASDLSSALEQELGMALPDIEIAWIASIP